jgi:hypothetical protein
MSQYDQRINDMEGILKGVIKKLKNEGKAVEKL